MADDLEVLRDTVSILRQQFGVHEAISLERQKTTFNSLASIDHQVSELRKQLVKMFDQLQEQVDRKIRHNNEQQNDNNTVIHDRIDKVSTRMNSWMTALAGAAVLSTGTLLVLIVTHGLKGY